MFDGADFPKPLDEEVFNTWLENGRLSLLGYHFLVIVWDEHDGAYQPVYLQYRREIEEYKQPGSRDRFIAAYDIYSENRIV